MIETQEQLAARMLKGVVRKPEPPPQPPKIKLPEKAKPKFDTSQIWHVAAFVIWIAVIIRYATWWESYSTDSGYIHTIYAQIEMVQKLQDEQQNFKDDMRHILEGESEPARNIRHIARDVKRVKEILEQQVAER